MKKKKKKHVHRWKKDLDACLACGAYEAMCRCGVIGLFDSKGKLLDIAE